MLVWLLCLLISVKTTNSFCDPYIQFNLGEPAPEMYYSYSALSITSNALIILLHLLRSVASLSFMCKSSASLSTTSLHVFLNPGPVTLCPCPGPTSLSGSLNLQITHSITQSSSFLKTFHFCGQLLLSYIPILNRCLNSMLQDSLSLNFTTRNNLIS